jgi:hypothetical protein
VDYQHETLVDPTTMLPILSMKKVQEGNEFSQEATLFDHAAGKAYYENRADGTKTVFDIAPDTRELLSFMYFMRGTPLTPDSSSEHRLVADGKVCGMTVNAKGATEIDLPQYDRNVMSLEVVPAATFDGLFVRKGEGMLWVSQDSRQVMTFAKMKAPFGRFRIKLQEVSGPGTDFWITELKKDENE